MTARASRRAGFRRTKAPRRATPRFGALLSENGYVDADYAAGMRQGMVEVNWFNFEQTEGVIDQGTVGIINGYVTAILGKGMGCTLATGAYDTPAWVANVAGAAFIDQTGKTAGDAPNTVFSQPVRNKIASYYGKLHTAFNLARFDTIRITSGADPECLYPNGQGTGYWAFDANAQGTGSGRPATVPVCPFPGWVPGTADLTLGQRRAWLDWYMAALADSINWQMTVLDGLGFTGIYELVMPGSGVRPSRVASLLAANLPPDAVMGVGAAWHLLLEKINKNGRVRVHCSSVADGSGNDDLTQPDDIRLSITDPAMDAWSSGRWLARLADEYGMRKSGENPGYGDSGTTAHYSDASTAGLMAKAVGQARAAGYDTFYWAHDFRFRDGTLPLSTYQTYINS